MQAENGCLCQSLSLASRSGRGREETEKGKTRLDGIEQSGASRNVEEGKVADVDVVGLDVQLLSPAV